jgi:hypothetical protein
MRRKRTAIPQCGVCARWTRDGDYLPSGNRDQLTGITPWDNFVCHNCQRETNTNWFVRRMVEGMVRDGA